MGTVLCVLLNMVFVKMHEMRLMPLIPYLALVSCLIYAVCKIKELMQRNAVFYQARNKRMFFMIGLFFAYALQMTMTFPVNIMYEKRDQPAEYYLQLDTVFLIQTTFAFIVGSILQFFIIYMLFRMIDNFKN